MKAPDHGEEREEPETAVRVTFAERGQEREDMRGSERVERAEGGTVEACQALLEIASILGEEGLLDVRDGILGPVQPDETAPLPPETQDRVATDRTSRKVFFERSLDRLGQPGGEIRGPSQRIVLARRITRDVDETLDRELQDAVDLLNLFLVLAQGSFVIFRQSGAWIRLRRERRGAASRHRGTLYVLAPHSRPELSGRDRTPSLRRRSTGGHEDPRSGAGSDR